MFVREKIVDGYTYLYFVENVREDDRAKQRIIRNLDCKDAVLAAGDRNRLLASVGRFARQSIILGSDGEEAHMSWPAVSAAPSCSAGCGTPELPVSKRFLLRAIKRLSKPHRQPLARPA